MAAQRFPDLIGREFRSELEGFLQELYGRMVRDPSASSAAPATPVMEDIRRKITENKLKKDDIFRLETEIKTGIADVLPKEEVPVWILLSLGLYLSSAPETGDTGKPASAFLFLPEAIPDEIYGKKDVFPDLRFLLSSYARKTDSGFYHILCERITNCAEAKADDIFYDVILQLWENKEYGKAVLLCDMFREFITGSKYDAYGKFFSAKKAFAERKYNAADDTFDLYKIPEDDETLYPLLPWWHYDAALYRAWLLKTRTGNTKKDSFAYCVKELKKAEEYDRKFFEKDEDRERLHLWIQLENEYLEMEHGADAEESELKKDEKLMCVREHYQNAFSYFWKEKSAHEKNLEIFKDTDIVDHIWCMIKTLAYVPNRTVNDRVVSDHEIIKCIRDLYEIGKNDPSIRHLSEYGPVIRYIESHPSSQIAAELLIAFLRALEILHTARIRDFNEYTIYLYTSFSNLKYILSDDKAADDKAGCKFRMPMFHAEHMNDPEEGLLIRNYFCRGQGSWLKRTPENGRTVSSENLVFLKSFSFHQKTRSDNTDIEEFLPMWNTYAEQTKGCCVILDSRTFSNDMHLRRVYYLEDTPNALKLSEKSAVPPRERRIMQYHLNGFTAAFHNLNDKINGEKSLKDDRELLNVVNAALDRISYLFKKETYQYENEIRLIKFLEEDELDSLKFIAGDTPKVYRYYDRQTYIREVILGAKFTNPNDVIPFIQNQGRKMWKEPPDSTGDACHTIRVSRSGLQYR